MNITVEMGNRIRYYRQLRKYSQEQLAEYSNLHPSYIGQLERGEKTPSIDTLYKLAGGLGITISTLCEGLEESAAETEYCAYKCFKLIEQQSIDTQKHILRIIEEISKIKN